MSEVAEGLTERQLKVLTGRLNSNRVSTRKQGGSTLSYLEAWDVKATLIRVFGFGGFSAEVLDTKVIEIDKTAMPASNGKDPYTRITACAMVTLRLTIHSLGAVYTESAVASQTGRDIGEVLDFAVKTAESDALKRAAIYLGTQFGLSLYNAGSKDDVIKVVFAPGQEWPPPQPEGDDVVVKDGTGAPVADAEAEAATAKLLNDKLGATPVSE